MPELLTIPGEKREETGRGTARAARREGRIPAVIYGGDSEPETITVRRQDVMKEIDKGGFLSTLFNIEFEGNVQRVLPKDVQLHPLKDWAQHVDFLRMPAGARTVVNVAVNFLNQEVAPGIKRGGILNVVRHEIELDVDVDNIPEAIDVDLAEANIGASIHISAVTLPDGVKPAIERDFTIATIAAPSGMADSEEDAEEAGGEE